MTTVDTTQQQQQPVYEQQQQPVSDTSAEETTTAVATEETTTVQEESQTPKQLSEADKRNNSSLFLEDKRSQGYQLTHINDGETNFFQYGEALSDEVKQMIVNSFDCEQDYVLQQRVAELFKQGNVWQSNTLINELYNMGLTVDVKTVATQYITDWKNGRSSYLRTDGAIDVLTISDGKGGQIVIADANGNGAIECEELFMNEILEGLAKDEFFAGDIGEVIGGKSGGGYSSSGSGSGSIFSSITSSIKDGITALKEKFSGQSKKISNSEYNRLIDDYISKNSCSVQDAIAQINSKYHYSSKDVQYSGRFKNTTLEQIDAITSASSDIELKREELEKLYNQK